MCVTGRPVLRCTRCGRQSFSQRETRRGNVQTMTSAYDSKLTASWTAASGSGEPRRMSSIHRPSSMRRACAALIWRRAAGMPADRSAAQARPCGVAGTTSVKRAGPSAARSCIAWTSSSESAVRLATTRTRSAWLGRPVRWDMGELPPSLAGTPTGDERITPGAPPRSRARLSNVCPERLAALDALGPGPLAPARVALDERQQREARARHGGGRAQQDAAPARDGDDRPRTVDQAGDDLRDALGRVPHAGPRRPRLRVAYARLEHRRPHAVGADRAQAHIADAAAPQVALRAQRVGERGVLGRRVERLRWRRGEPGHRDDVEDPPVAGFPHDL